MFTVKLIVPHGAAHLTGLTGEYRFGVPPRLGDPIILYDGDHRLEFDVEDVWHAACRTESREVQYTALLKRAARPHPRLTVIDGQAADWTGLRDE